MTDTDNNAAADLAAIRADHEKQLKTALATHLAKLEGHYMAHCQRCEARESKARTAEQRAAEIMTSAQAAADLAAKLDAAAEVRSQSLTARELEFDQRLAKVKAHTATFTAAAFGAAPGE